MATSATTMAEATTTWEHQGPIFDPVVNTRNGGDWGDIIPPIPFVHDGRNADAQGQAILDNLCVWVPAPIINPPGGG